MSTLFEKNFPIISSLKNYKKQWLGGDLSAGLTVGVMLIPQGMAYSMLAGLPPIYGLYASTIPLLIYALFGTSRQLAVGPVAVVAILISSSVGQFADLRSAEFISLAILLALMVGVIQFVMGLFRSGFLVNFLSHPVILGFTSGAVVIIGFSQIRNLLGIEIPRGKVHETVRQVIQHLDNINYPTLGLGLAAILILILIKRQNKRIPGPLIVVLFGIGIVKIFNLTTYGVDVVGEVPGGLPSFKFPVVEIKSIKMLLSTAVTIAIIGFIESIAVARVIRQKHKNYELNSNQELKGLGLANIIGSFFHSFPVTGGFSRTAVNNQAGAKTGLAAIFSATLIVITLLFLTEYFYYLPIAVLSAIILVAITGLIDIREARYLWHTDKKDFILFVITAVGTIVLGVEDGIILGAILSMVVVVYNISYPHMAVLGSSHDGNIYRNIERFEGVEQLDDTLIIRFDAQLYFANINYFKDFVWSQIHRKPDIRHFILDASAINNLDSTSIHALHDLIIQMKSKGIQFYMVNIKGPVRDKLHKSQLTVLIGTSFILNNVTEAVNLIKFGTQPIDENRGFAIQTND